MSEPNNRIKWLRKLQILIVFLGIALFFFAMGAGSGELIDANFAGILVLLSIVLIVGGVRYTSRSIKKELTKEESTSNSL
jgi:uncharacterized membrane protein YhaH (DUF805 family)